MVYKIGKKNTLYYTIIYTITVMWTDKSILVQTSHFNFRHDITSVFSLYWKFPYLQQEWANFNQESKSSLTCVLQVNLGNITTLIHVHNIYGCFCETWTELSCSNRDPPNPQNRKCSLPGPLHKKITNLCSMFDYCWGNRVKTKNLLST